MFDAEIIKLNFPFMKIFRPPRPLRTVIPAPVLQFVVGSQVPTNAIGRFLKLISQVKRFNESLFMKHV